MKTKQQIMIEASKIAGAIWDDREKTGTLAEQLIAASNWANRGTDGDLTAEDRLALRKLAGEAVRAQN